jgi:hypothetical protein
MKKSVLIIAAVFVFGVANVAFAANDNDEDQHNLSLRIDEITLLDIEDGNGGSVKDFIFEINPSDLVSEAGAAFNSTIELKDRNSREAFLQYTALVANKKYVKAEITSGSLPNGFSLNVKADEAKNGKGKVGNEKNKYVKLTNSGEEIISNIGTSYTGTGGKRGHKLDYQLEIENNADIAKLSSGSFDITVTYTITE